jgi:hypothetical protein
MIGVEVSAEKTLESLTTFEFAKRYFHEGEEVTPFPISSVLNSRKSIDLLVSALKGEERRSLVPRSGTPGAVKKLFERLHYRSSVINRVFDRAYRCEQSFLFTTGSITASEFLSRLSVSDSALRSKAHLIDDKLARLVIGKTVEEMFAASLSNPSLDLGRLAVDLVERFTGRDDRFGEDGFLLIYALPFLSIYGQVEEMYMRCLKDHSRL